MLKRGLAKIQKYSKKFTIYKHTVAILPLIFSGLYEKSSVDAGHPNAATSCGGGLGVGMC